MTDLGVMNLKKVRNKKKSRETYGNAKGCVVKTIG